MWAARTRKTWTLNFTKRPCPTEGSRVSRMCEFAVTDDTRLGPITTITHQYREYSSHLHHRFSDSSHKRDI